MIFNTRWKGIRSDHQHFSGHLIASSPDNDIFVPVSGIVRWCCQSHCDPIKWFHQAFHLSWIHEVAGLGQLKCSRRECQRVPIAIHHYALFPRLRRVPLIGGQWTWWTHLPLEKGWFVFHLKIRKNYFLASPFEICNVFRNLLKLHVDLCVDVYILWKFRVLSSTKCQGAWAHKGPRISC